MKKVTKSLFSWLLALCMILTAMPMTAYAAEDTSVSKTTPRVQLGEDTYPTLKAALEAAENVGGEVTLSLLEDVEWETGANHGSTPLLAANSKVTKLTINGNNKTLTATGDGVGAIGAANDALVVFNEVNVVDKSESYVENSWELGYLEFRGKLEINNCKFNNAIMLEGESDNLSNEIDAIFNGCSFDSGKENEYALWVSEGRATVKDSTFTGTRGLKMHEAYKTDVESVTVDNCKFGPLSEKPGIAIGTVNESTEVTIKNSKFVDCQAGDQSLYIYETDTPVDTFKFTNQDNYVCNADTDGTHGTTKTINTKPATCKDEGYTGDEVCVACGDVVKAGKVIGKTTHKFVDDKCTVCGATDPAAILAKDVAAGTLALNKKIKTTWKGSKLVVTWGKVSKANGYDIYAAKCGKKYVCVRTITKNSTTSYKFSKIGRTKLSTKNKYRVLVKAYRMVNGKKQYIGTSVETHAVGKNNKKYTNAKSVKVSGGKNVTLKVGKTKKIKATINKESGKKSILKSSHIAKFRYFSSNTNIATVSKKGTIKAKAKGKCNVYVMTANGVKATIKVTVK